MRRAIAGILMGFLILLLLSGSFGGGLSAQMPSQAGEFEVFLTYIPVYPLPEDLRVDGVSTRRYLPAETDPEGSLSLRITSSPVYSMTHPSFQVRASLVCDGDYAVSRSGDASVVYADGTYPIGEIPGSGNSTCQFHAWNGENPEAGDPHKGAEDLLWVVSQEIPVRWLWNAQVVPLLVFKGVGYVYTPGEAFQISLTDSEGNFPTGEDLVATLTIADVLPPERPVFLGKYLVKEGIIDIPGIDFPSHSVIVLSLRVTEGDPIQGVEYVSEFKFALVGVNNP
jgi:hypothetical protein